MTKRHDKKTSDSTIELYGKSSGKGHRWFSKAKKQNIALAFRWLYIGCGAITLFGTWTMLLQASDVPAVEVVHVAAEPVGMRAVVSETNTVFTKFKVAEASEDFVPTAKPPVQGPIMQRTVVNKTTIDRKGSNKQAKVANTTSSLNTKTSKNMKTNSSQNAKTITSQNTKTILNQNVVAKVEHQIDSKPNPKANNTLDEKVAIIKDAKVIAINATAAKTKNNAITDAPVKSQEQETIALDNYMPNKRSKHAGFGEVNVVNLEFRPQKWNTMVTSLKASKVLRVNEIRRIIGVYGKKANLFDLYEQSKLGSKGYRSLVSPRVVGGHYMTAGGLGCLLSHVKVWQRSVQIGRPVVVFEDDVNLNSDFDARFATVLKDLPADFGLFYFADLVNTTASQESAFDFNPKSSITILKNGEHWGTYAYMIGPVAARILLDHVYPLNFQVDSFMIQTCLDFNISVYRSKTNLVSTDNSGNRVSDVQESHIEGTIDIPIKFHMLDIEPYSAKIEHEFQIYRKQLHRMRIGTIEYWDKPLIREIDTDGLFMLDEEDPFYMLEVLCIKVAIVVRRGGLVKDVFFSPRHSLRKFISNIDGLIAFDTSHEVAEAYTYPLVVSNPDSPVMKLIQVCLNKLLRDARMYHGSGKTPKHLRGRNIAEVAHECITQYTTQFPGPGHVISFPAAILKQNGFA